VIYLATAHTHELPAVEEVNYALSCYAIGRLFKAGFPAYSPIVHWHPIVKYMPTRPSVQDWIKLDKEMLDFCTEMVVPDYPNITWSKGVEYEIAYYRQQRKTVWRFNPYAPNVELRETKGF